MDKLAMLTQILTQNPQDAFARYGLAMEFVAQNRIPEALAAFDTLIALNPDYVPAYQMSAQTMAANHMTEQAIERLHQGIATANRIGNQHALAEMDALRLDLTGQDLTGE